MADRFNINRPIRYRNSFLPILHGRFSSNGNGTLIDVRMIMHPFVIVFVLFWSGTGLIGFFEIASDVLHGVRSVSLWVPLFMFAFVYFLTFFGFGFEAQKATNMLNDIFNPPTAQQVVRCLSE